MSPQSPKPPAPRPGAPRSGAPRPVAPRPADDRRLAKDVAKYVDRRRMRRKLLWWAFFVTAIVLAALYATCGRGFGLGGLGLGLGEGEGPGEGSVKALMDPVDAGPRRCQIRIAASGISADGKAVTVEEAVAACKDATAAEVLVTGGARAGDWEDLKAAFERAGIKILRVERKSGSADAAGSADGSAGTEGGDQPGR